jgi:cytochrome c-type biogenesis protein CcmF
VPLTLMLVLLSGVGPVIAWRRADARQRRRAFAVPPRPRSVTTVACLAAGLGDRIAAVAMFAAGAFVFGTVAQEFWRGTGARRAMAGEAAPMAVVQLVRRNRRRYGGYIVHLGMALLFIGVAASSAFETASDQRLQPGQTVRVGDYDVTYVRSTAGFARESGSLEAIRLGAVLRVQRDGDEPFKAVTERRYYPAQDGRAGPVGQFFEGEATSEIALQAGLTRDFWAAYQPDQEVVRKLVDGLDKRFADASPARPPRPCGSSSRSSASARPPRRSG